MQPTVIIQRLLLTIDPTKAKRAFKRFEMRVAPNGLVLGVACFREIASIVGRDGPPDQIAVVATMRNFGLVPVAPPSAGQ